MALWLQRSGSLILGFLPEVLVGLSARAGAVRVPGQVALYEDLYGIQGRLDQVLSMVGQVEMEIVALEPAALAEDLVGVLDDLERVLKHSWGQVVFLQIENLRAPDLGVYTGLVEHSGLVV